MTGRIVVLTLLVVLPLWAVDVTNIEVPTEHGPFSITKLTVTGRGPEKGIRLKWNGTATNDTGREWHKVTLCVRAFDADGAAIQAAQETCLLRLWMYDWKPGLPARWKGSQKVRVGDAGNQRIEVARLEISVEEILVDPESVKEFPQTCDKVWPVALQTFLGEKFRPTVSDKDTLVASFEYTGGQTVGKYSRNVENAIKSYTSTYTGFWKTWEAFRIDSASLMLRRIRDHNCRAEIKMSFAGFEKGWFELASNHQYEKRLLAAMEAQLGTEYEQDLDHAISKLPAAGEEATGHTEEPRNEATVEITSEPAKAEIEIDGEYVGSTPSTLTIPLGTRSITIKKRGFQPWERKLRFREGDKRTVHAELEEVP